MKLTSPHLLYHLVRTLHQSSEDEHIENRLSNVLSRHGDGEQTGFRRRCATGQERGIDQAGQHNYVPSSNQYDGEPVVQHKISLS